MTTAGLSAGTAAAVGAAGALALLILYLVGRRAVRVVVPFAGPWLASSSPRSAGRWGRRVRWAGSLVLQLAILSSLVLAATDWANRDDELGGRSATSPGHGGGSRSTRGRTVALVLDRSASMQATDEPGSRMSRARALARDAVAALAPEDRAVVVSFAAGAAAHTGLESDHARLLAAIDDVQASEEPGDLAGALDFAATLLRDQPHPTLTLFGDGGGPEVASAAVGEALRQVDLRYVPVGQRARNLAIVAFSARRQPGDPSSAEMSLVVQSFQDAPADVELVVSSGAEAVPVARRRLHLPGRARQAQALSGVPIPDPRLEARLVGAGDDLPLDDRAFAVVPATPPLSVMVVGTPDLYLEGALLSLGGAAQLERVTPGQLEGGARRLAAADVVILHGVTPPPEALRFDEPPPDETSPAAQRRPGVLYLDPAGLHSPWREQSPGRELRDPIVARVVREHPLMRGLSLVDLNVLGARRLTPGRDDTVVAATADDVPLLIARDRAGARAVALAFDPRRSDLPLRSAFPLLLANALTWLAQRAEPGGLSRSTGRTTTVDVPGSALRSYQVRAPDGSRVAATPVASGVQVTLDRTGIHSVMGAASRPVALVAANLASAAESDLTPRPNVRVGDRAFLPPVPASTPAPGRRPHLPVLALLVALALCTGEWLAHHRRVTV